MKRYPAGTRVRVTNSRTQPGMVGAEGKIIALVLDTDGYYIDFPGRPNWDGSTVWTARHSTLEPILNEYDGHETTTWDECPWQPEGVKVCVSS